MPSFLSSRLALGTALVAVGLGLTFGVVACSDSVGPSPSTEGPPTAKSTTSVPTDEGEVYMVVEDPPELVGGMEALQEAVHYPEMAKEAGIEGRVIVHFVVNENGNVTNPKVTRGADKLLNKAAIEALKEQEFNPGKQSGEPVKVQMSIPVAFKLPDNDSSSTSSSRSSSERQVNSATAGLVATKHYSSDVSRLSRKTLVRLHEGVTYPALARKAGMEGQVLVRFTVDGAGEAINPRVVNDQHSHLDEVPDLLAKAALHAVTNTRLTPRFQDGELVSKEIGIKFQFLLPNDAS